MTKTGMTRRQNLTALPPFAALLVIYVLSLQITPNGSAHYFMLDVGETQIVLNSWGTLHATGYPLYVMSGNLTVAALRLIGIAPAAAPSVVSLIWMLAAMALIYALMRHITRRTLIPALVVALYGLTRTVWIHGVIPEVYSMTLFLVALLLVIALWRGEIRGRVLWLASIGGIGIGHHRAIAMLIPGLTYAAWGDVIPAIRRPRTVIAALLLGLAGLLPYAYLYVRAQAGAAWVYGEPGTLAGLWDQFIGREASRFIGSISSIDGLIANFNLVNNVLISDLTLPGLIVGAVGLVIGVRGHDTRRPAITLILIGAVCYGFHVFVYSDVLSALILPITLMFAFGWLFVGERVLASSPHPLSEKQPHPPTPSPKGEGETTRLVKSPLLFSERGFRGEAVIIIIALVFAGILYTQNRDFIANLTEDTTGQQTIARVQSLPSNGTIMIPWGIHHHAVGFARDVLGIRTDIRLVDHKADYAAILAQGRLFTLSDVFYNQPISWWEERIGERIYLTAAAPYLVEIGTQPRLTIVDARSSIEGVIALDYHVICTDSTYALAVDWYTPTIPDRNLSVFVHATDQAGNVVTADQSAPVYGWRPLTTWTPRELVSDYYPLPPINGLREIQFGLYEQLPSGEFRNTVEYTVTDIPECAP